MEATGLRVALDLLSILSVEVSGGLEILKALYRGLKF
jgi:hypothetical protein